MLETRETEPSSQYQHRAGHQLLSAHAIFSMAQQTEAGHSLRELWKEGRLHASDYKIAMRAACKACAHLCPTKVTHAHLRLHLQARLHAVVHRIEAYAADLGRVVQQQVRASLPATSPQPTSLRCLAWPAPSVRGHANAYQVHLIAMCLPAGTRFGIPVAVPDLELHTLKRAWVRAVLDYLHGRNRVLRHPRETLLQYAVGFSGDAQIELELPRLEIAPSTETSIAPQGHRK